MKTTMFILKILDMINGRFNITVEKMSKAQDRALKLNTER